MVWHHKTIQPGMAGAASHPLQVLLQDDSRAFQARLRKPVTTQPEALGVDWDGSGIERKLIGKTQNGSANHLEMNDFNGIK